MKDGSKSAAHEWLSCAREFLSCAAFFVIIAAMIMLPSLFIMGLCVLIVEFLPKLFGL